MISEQISLRFLGDLCVSAGEIIRKKTHARAQRSQRSRRENQKDECGELLPQLILVPPAFYGRPKCTEPSLTVGLLHRLKQVSTTSR
jgi:hypothetical protein